MKRIYPSINGSAISEDNAVTCTRCERIMAKWEIADHCCDYAQLIEMPNTLSRTQPILFGGVAVGILKEHGNKLAYYLPDDNIPYMVVEIPAVPYMWDEDV